MRGTKFFFGGTGVGVRLLLCRACVMQRTCMDGGMLLSIRGLPGCLVADVNCLIGGGGVWGVGSGYIKGGTDTFRMSWSVEGSYHV